MYGCAIDRAKVYALANANVAEERQRDGHQSSEEFQTFQILKRVVVHQFL